MRPSPSCFARIAFALPLLAATTLRAQQDYPPEAMDYGPFLSATVGAPAPKDNVTLKGIAIRLGTGDEAAVLFDTELLRLAAAWTGGYLQLTGTPYDGAHGGHPRIRGTQVQGTRPGPGVARAGSWADPRPIPYGPLPREHARYQGLFVHGDRVVVRWRAGGREVLEGHGVLRFAGQLAITRTLECGAGEELLVAALDRDEDRPELRADGRLAWFARTLPAQQLVTMERVSRNGPEGRLGRPSRTDLAEPGKGPAKASRPAGPGRIPPLVLDLGALTEVAAIQAFTEGRNAVQRFALFGSTAETAPDLGEDPAGGGWTGIAEVDSAPLGSGGTHVVRIQDRAGTLGRFRHLAFVSRLGTGTADAAKSAAAEVRGREEPQGEAKEQAPPPFFAHLDVFAAGANAPRPLPSGPWIQAVALLGAGALRVAEPGRIAAQLPGGPAARSRLAFWDGPAEHFAAFQRAAAEGTPEDLAPLTKAGPKRYPQTLTTQGVRGNDEEPYAVDTLTVPETNPWNSRLRFGAFDLFADGRRAALSTWNGDVWVVADVSGDLRQLTWKRYATGLFDPLGLRIVGDKVYTLGRDQITRLHDHDGDGEADEYENFNNEVLISAAFHEFAFDLQTDREGNFYFAKGGPVRGGGRGFEKILPHHGTILKVSRDGSKLEVFATGLRAPNGIGVGPNGEVTSGDNEGTWMPVCRLNWVPPGAFLGCVDTAHRSPPPTTYDPPLCFLPYSVDNSCGGQLWVPDDRFGPFRGDLLHLSYGQSSVFKVLIQDVDGVKQGAVVRFPWRFASSCMRGRFHPGDGSLFVVGFQGWQTNAARLTAFHRVRFTGKPVTMPRRWAVTEKGIELEFTAPVSRELAEDLESWHLEQWNYVWGEQYGSPEISTTRPANDPKALQGDYKDLHEHDVVKVAKATLRPDGRTVFLEIPDLRPVMQIQIRYDLEDAAGKPLRDAIHGSIHKLAKDGAR